jgi:hypothetical protein
MKKLFAALLLLPALSFAQACPEGQKYDACQGTRPGPAICTPGCVPISNDEPTAGPSLLCIRDECQLVRYSWTGDLAIAESQLANGYSVLGWAGPCVHADRSQCPDIFNQAFQDLKTNALRSNRAQEAQQ